MKKTLVATAFLAALTAQAFAGNSTMTKGDQKIKLWCNNGGCYVADFVNAFKTKNKRKLGPGGRNNYLMHRTSYKSKGWK